MSPSTRRRYRGPGLPIGRFGLKSSEWRPPVDELGSKMPIADPVLGAAMNCTHLPETLLAVRDLADREVVGCAGWIITAQCR